MESLEDVLKRVDNLRYDLSAEIITTQERGDIVIENEPDPDYANMDYPPTRTGRYPQAPIEYREPDDKRRESAKSQLTQIYDSSEWYSARFKAGRLIKIKNELLEQEINNWFDNLQLEENAPEEIFRNKAKEDIIKVYELFKEDWKCSQVYENGMCMSVSIKLMKRAGIMTGLSEYQFLLDQLNFMSEDFRVKNRIKYCITDEQLKNIYIDIHLDKKYRLNAGKALGYSSMQLAFHESITILFSRLMNTH